MDYELNYPSLLLRNWIQTSQPSATTSSKPRKPGKERNTRAQESSAAGDRPDTPSREDQNPDRDEDEKEGAEEELIAGSVLSGVTDPVESDLNPSAASSTLEDSSSTEDSRFGGPSTTNSQPRRSLRIQERIQLVSEQTVGGIGLFCCSQSRKYGKQWQ